MHRRNRSKGFTVLELLVAVSIVGVLAGLAIQNFSLYRKRAYEAVAESLLGDTKKALEIGRTDINDRDAEQWYFAWSNVAGPVRDPRGHDFLPGLMNPRDTQLSAWYMPPCDNGEWGEWCALEGATIRHCKAQKFYSWMKLRDGTETTVEFELPFPC